MDAAMLAERLPLPDPLLRAAIACRVGATARAIATKPEPVENFVAGMGGRPIAEHADAANRQHYELPPEFFALCLGPHRKYSSCLYPTGRETLAEAERAALAETCQHADLRDGQRVLELGCGWGSLSLWMAESYPASTIIAVSNSAPQRRHIEAEAARRGLANLRVVTDDMNRFAPEGQFDRVVSVEMFEHMANWRRLLERVRGWLVPGGALFLHVFSHATSPYRFDVGDDADWIAQHFFTGGLMPSHRMTHHFPDLFAVEREWRWSGTHYQRTALHWLANMDANRAAIMPILRDVYGRDHMVWWRRWRLFYLATAGLFGHDSGRFWGVTHCLMRPMGAPFLALRGKNAAEA